MTRRLILASFLVGIPFSVAGCGTIANTCWLTEDEGGNRVYGGVRGMWQVASENMAAASDPDIKNPDSAWPPIVDMPFSFVGDTLTLPITISISGWRAIASQRSVTHGINASPRMVEAVLSRIPIGTSIDDAETFMKSEGFKCSRSRNAEFLDRKSLDYVYCDRTEGGVVVQRRWQIAIVYRDGKVVEVLGSTGLVGP